MNILNSRSFCCRRTIWSTFLISFALIFTAAAQPDLNFIRYNTEHGLANNDVLSICQDQYGFMWFGTKGGFCRFDGVSFQNYRYDKFDSLAISGEWVNQIVCDNQNRLWFAMTDKNGFVKYDYNKGSFEVMTQSIYGQVDLSPDKYVFWNIFADSQGHIWLPYVISYFNPEDSSVFQIPQIGTAVDYFEDPGKNIWIATIDNGLLKYNKEKVSFLTFKNNPDNPKSLSSKLGHNLKPILKP